ncbi:MAG TPA: pectate lyase [Tepidisphaeraceae bacterium]|jgi:pectate lyase|nr:pectate lyase [Tepidisphaeraceae bacterium]
MRLKLRVNLRLLGIAVALLCITYSQAVAISVQALSGRSDAWLASEEGRRVIGNIITWQIATGGWAKGYDASRARSDNEPHGDWKGVATIDNGSTYSELRLLGRSLRLKHDPHVLTAFNRGLDALLKAQYANGGWPQRFPPPAKGYGRYITFNDGAMVAVLRLMRDVATTDSFGFVDPGRRSNAQAAFDRGIDCILRCQVIIDGRPTGWCAQHDPDTFEPMGARAYELPSLSGFEGAGVALLLMELDAPDARMRAAITGAAEWFAVVAVKGKRLEERKNPGGSRNLLLVDDRNSTIWARFYDLKTNRPLFANRDGQALQDYDQLPAERRDGYRWFGPWGQRVADSFATWKAKHPTDESKASAAAPHKQWDVTAD